MRIHREFTHIRQDPPFLYVQHLYIYANDCDNQNIKKAQYAGTRALKDSIYFTSKVQ